jgi:hypothetical protein
MREVISNVRPLLVINHLPVLEQFNVPETSRISVNLPTFVLHHLIHYVFEVIVVLDMVSVTAVLFLSPSLNLFVYPFRVILIWFSSPEPQGLSDTWSSCRNIASFSFKFY